MSSTAQASMPRAAASIAALIPARSATRLMGDRTEQLVFTVYEGAAGKVFATTNPGIPVSDAVWTPGVTRQSEPRPRPRTA